MSGCRGGEGWRLKVSQLERTRGIPLSRHLMRHRLPCDTQAQRVQERVARDGETGDQMQLASIRRAATTWSHHTTTAMTQRYALCCSSPFEHPEERHTNIPRAHPLYEGKFT